MIQNQFHQDRKTAEVKVKVLVAVTGTISRVLLADLGTERAEDTVKVVGKDLVQIAKSE